MWPSQNIWTLPSKQPVSNIVVHNSGQKFVPHKHVWNNCKSFRDVVPISPDYDDAIWTVLTLGEGAKAPATQSDHPFKTSANFHDFLPLPPYHRHSSKILMKGIFDPYVTFWPSAYGDTPSPTRHADFLNGWSQYTMLYADYMYNDCT